MACLIALNHMPKDKEPTIPAKRSIFLDLVQSRVDQSHHCHSPVDPLTAFGSEKSLAGTDLALGIDSGANW
jgi:hypothetical protein